jgi:hypothetical protein
MRRIVLAVTALVVLIASGAAYAATLNNYTATLTTSESGSGTAAKPVAFGFTERLTAQNMTTGMNAAPLTDIKLTATGVKANPQYFPKCTAAQITAALSDTGCPKGALVATGSITSVLGPTTLTGGTPCAPLLHVWNGGGGKVVFFFVIGPGHLCGALTTGAAAPYVGTLKQAGSTLIQDTPLPPDVSTSAGNLPGTYGSLEVETLKWLNISAKVKGKKIPFLQSTGCTKNKRNYTVKFTATNGTISESGTIAGKATC